MTRKPAHTAAGIWQYGFLFSVVFQRLFFRLKRRINRPLPNQDRSGNHFGKPNEFQED